MDDAHSLEHGTPLHTYRQLNRLESDRSSCFCWSKPLSVSWSGLGLLEDFLR